jgi:FkbM family methyltransferase
MNEPLYLIKRFIRHLYRGTLTNRIQQEWYEHVKRRRLVWWQCQIGKKEEYFIFRLQSGIKIKLYFDSRLCQLIYCYDFESNERKFLNDFLRKGDLFIDIGANIGLFTLIASYCVGKNGCVYSIEPCSKTYRRLVRNVELNGMNNVKCEQIALTDHTGQVEMNVSLDGYDAWNSIAQPISGDTFTIESVKARSLDDFSREHQLMGSVTMMKIDVEGWESHVISGGCETLSRTDAPVLQVEFTDQASQSAGTSCQALYHQLENLGYRMYLYDGISKRIVPYPMRESYPYVNLLAVKNPDTIHSRLNKG